ncbi:MAG TPA: hypothetical protein ENN20_11110 [Candidatus Marinimicrobia bacterium]|nr:hypothetical protein [Candidatus Neomarinimicrobiota bacterium]
MIRFAQFITENESLGSALTLMNQLFSDYLPVVDTVEGKKFCGILDRRLIKQSVNRRMIATAGQQSRN